MLKHLVLLVVLAAPSLRGQQGPTGTPGQNDLTKTLAACGTPAKDKARAAHGMFAQERDLTYRGVTLTFTDTLPDSWVLFSVHRPGHVLVYGTGALPEARRLLACLPDLNAQQTATTPVRAAKPMPAADSDRISWGAIAFTLAIALVIGCIALYQMGMTRMWNRRPRRLCIACNSITQPLQYKNGRWYCPVCQADNPIPLNSPAAFEYLRQRGMQPPSA